MKKSENVQKSINIERAIKAVKNILKTLVFMSTAVLGFGGLVGGGGQSQNGNDNSFEKALNQVAENLKRLREKEDRERADALNKMNDEGKAARIDAAKEAAGDYFKPSTGGST